MAEKLKELFNQKLKSFLALIGAVVIGIILIILIIWSGSQTGTGYMLNRPYEKGWTSLGNNPVTLQNFYNIRSNDRDGTLRAYNVLPEIHEGDALNLEARYINFEVTIDGQKVYVYDSVNRFAGTVFDSSFHHIALTPSMSGKQVEISAKNDGGSSRMRFTDVCIGPSYLYIQHMLMKNIVPFILSLLFVMTGFIGLINEISQKYLKYSYNRVALHVSAMLIGFFMMVASTVPMLLLPDATEIFIVGKYLCLMCLPFPAFGFVSSILPHKNRSWNVTLLVMNIICVVAMVALSLSGVLEWHECIFFFYVMAIYIAIVFVELTFASFKDAATEHVKVDIDWLVFTGALAVSVTLLLDCFYVISDNTDSDMPFSVWGVLIMLIITIIDTELEARKHLADTGYLMNERDKAYVDQLTGILNRTAYERDSDVLRDSFSKDSLSGNAYLDSHFDLLIAYFDINNFKHVNDTLGHDTGDKVIQAAATLINKAFGKYGKVYRVGGDEFCATLTGDDLDRSYGRALHDLRMEEDEWNQNTKLQITLKIASGCAKLSDTESGTLSEVLKNADNDMYLHKAEMKKNNPDQVRGA